MKSLEDKVWEKLKQINDPELGVGLVGLGLIYDVRAESGEVEIDMTLTRIGCPMADQIVNEIKEETMKIDGVRDVLVEIVWEPPWSMDKMSDEVRTELGF
jgi:metal-sulfur cluster biosynthetic enzyme